MVAKRRHRAERIDRDRHVAVERAGASRTVCGGGPDGRLFGTGGRRYSRRSPADKVRRRRAPTARAPRQRIVVGAAALRRRASASTGRGNLDLSRSTFSFIRASRQARASHDRRAVNSRSSVTMFNKEAAIARRSGGVAILPACAIRPGQTRRARRGCGCSSGVEHDLAKVGVEGSNPFARSNFL